MINTKSSLAPSAPYFQPAQNIFPPYPRISAPSDSFYLATDGSGFPSNPSFLPFVPRPEGRSFPPGLVAGSLAADAAGDAWRGMPTGPPAAACWPYDSLHSFHYGPSYGGLDVRRKNATRESTSTLKAWLYEHIKNPYPTKGEKIMLAIITKMTLTQVSTWFANARRRLKKENKMQWSPRNRTGEDDDDEDDDDKNSDVIDDGRREDDEEDGDVIGRKNGVDDGDGEEDDEIIVDTDKSPFIPFPINIVAPTYLPSKIFESAPRPKSPIDPRDVTSPPPPAVKEKPRIWSLADVATSGLEDNGETGRESKPAVVKSTLQLMSDEDRKSVQHPTSHRSIDQSEASQFFHKLHAFNGGQLSHLQNLYRTHLARPRHHTNGRRLSPKSIDSEDSSASSKNFETRQHLYQSAANITVTPQIR